MSHHQCRHFSDTSVFSPTRYFRIVFFTILSSLMLALGAGSAMAQDLVITGVIDGPLSGGTPKAVEVFVLADIADLSIYGVGGANNGGGTDGEEFTFPAVSASCGSFIYVSDETPMFNAFFGFDPDYTSFAATINGDDAIELFQNGSVVDVFGDINVDGSGQAWEYLDGWAYRANSTGPDGTTFTIGNWSFSGPNALDGETSNGTASTPFPTGSYVPAVACPETAPAVSNTSPSNSASGVAVDASVTINFNEDVALDAGWYDITCTGSGAHTAVVSGGPKSFTVDPDVDFDNSENCTVTIEALKVHDLDSDDPPDTMAADSIFSFDTADPSSPATFVINEFLADPASGSAGDANGDGTRDFSDDEFVELVNISGGDMDISGWTLADGASVRHTFPVDSIVLEGCSVVVFGGDTPTGVFGKSLIQTASTGAVGLNNSGDTITLNDGASDVAVTTYGSEGGDNQSLTLDPDVSGTLPYVKHSEASSSSGSLFSPGTNADGSQFAGCPPVWIINEFLADPASDLPGDANGDGIRHFGDDEFIEIVNSSDINIDISSWTLADGAQVRHSFPSDTVVFSGCSIVVFGGDTPTGTFGNSLVQTASTGSVGLSNGGDTITLNNGTADVAVTSYGSEGGDNQSLTLDPDVSGTLPYVKHSAATGSGGTLFSPGTKIDGTQFAGCPVAAEIYEIQGAGASSPLEDTPVLTDGDVVTALAPDGFFMQTPAGLTDGDSDTSDGVFVFTGTAPAVAVGDLVDVTGTVDEFFGFTEITGSPVVTVVGTSSLPPVVAFGPNVPSPNPASPSCSIEYECYEGMLVKITGGAVTGGNQDFGSDPIAEPNITAGSARTFRAPGTEFPLDLGGSIPQWDGNPEVFELDPDKLGLANQTIFGGSSFTATGVIGFDFGDYELWPTELEFTQAALPTSVRNRMMGETTVGSLNMFRFASDGDYAVRLAKLSKYVRLVLNSPDILGVQEVADIGALQDLAEKIALDDGSVNYTAHLFEGNDIGGIDVGFLLRSDIDVGSLSQMGAAEIFTFDNSLLHDRPPLLLEAIYTGNGKDFRVTVLVVHNRSLNGIDTERVQLKRLAQAQSIATMVQNYQSAYPRTPLIVLGDFNAFEFTDGYVDAVGHIMGDINPSESLQSGPDLVSPNLTNQVYSLPAGERYSFVFNGNAQVLDHALTSSAVDRWVRGFEFGRGNSDAAHDQINDAGTAMRSSDHDGFVLFLMTDRDGDNVADDVDECPVNPYLVRSDPQSGCVSSVPTLDPVGMLLMFLMLGGLGAITVRSQHKLKRQ